MTTTVEAYAHSCQYSSDGESWEDFSSYVEGFTTHHGHTADRGTISISCYAYPSGLAENDYLVCFIDGSLVFNGRVARPALHYIGNSVIIEGEDIMANLANPWGGEGEDPELDELFSRVYEGQAVSGIITNYCEAMAVPVELHDIEDSAWIVGTLYPVTLRVGQAPTTHIREWDEVEGCWTATRNNGAITRRPLSVGSADFTATEGDNIISSDRTPRGTESIINRWVVFGFEYEGATIGGFGVGDYQLDNENIPDPPKSRTKVLRSNFVETDEDALAFATAGVDRTNFPYDETNIVVLGDTSITIGQTGQIDSTALDHAGDDTSLRFAADVEHRYGVGVGYETSVKCIRVAT